MAKKHQVGIEIKTTADPKGARQVEDALEEVESQARKVREALDKVPGLDPKVRAQIEGVADSMDRAAVSGRQMATQTHAVGKTSQNSGLAVLEFSRAIEDAQYGIRGVLNNIPSLLSYLGAGAGLAGAVSLAAVGLTVLTTALTAADEETKDLSESVELTRKQIDEFYSEASRDGTAGFRTQIMRVVEALGEQNQALVENLRLTRLKRQAELRVAAAGQDLQLANIAARELTQELSPEQADAERRAIEIARIRAARDEKLLAAQEELELVEQQRRDSYQRQIKTAERLEEAEARRAALIEERNRLQQRQVEGEAMVASGQKELEGAFLETTKIEARGKINRGRILFSEEMRQRLIELESVLLPQAEELTRSLQQAGSSIERQREELMVATSQAAQQAQVVQETETAVADLQVQTIEVKAKTEAQKAAIEEGNRQLRDILADGIVDAQERQQIAQTMQRLETEQGLANSATVQAMRGLLLEAQLTRKEIEAIKQNIQRLEASRGR